MRCVHICAHVCETADVIVAATAQAPRLTRMRRAGRKATRRVGKTVRRKWSPRTTAVAATNNEGVGVVEYSDPLKKNIKKERK